MPRQLDSWLTGFTIYGNRGMSRNAAPVTVMMEDKKASYGLEYSRTAFYRWIVDTALVQEEGLS